MDNKKLPTPTDRNELYRHLRHEHDAGQELVSDGGAGLRYLNSLNLKELEELHQDEHKLYDEDDAFKSTIHPHSHD